MHEIPPCPITAALTCRLLSPTVVFCSHRCRCRLMSPTVVFLLPSAEFIAFPNRHCDMHTPQMMMPISKSLPRNSGEILNTSPSRRRHRSTNSYSRSIGPGVRDGRGRSYGNRSSMTVSTSTTRQDLHCHHPPRPKVASHNRAAQREKRYEARIPTKKDSHFLHSRCSLVSKRPMSAYSAGQGAGSHW
jgi:hypothetical protein